MSPRSIFPTAQRFSFPKHVTSGSMSPRSLFPTAQRFPIRKHVTSGSMSPRSIFPTAQRFPITLPVMTSLDQSEARISVRMGVPYYWPCTVVGRCGMIPVLKSQQPSESLGFATRIEFQTIPVLIGLLKLLSVPSIRSSKGPVFGPAQI